MSPQNLRNSRLMRIAYHPCDTFDRGQFVGRALRVAAGDDDARGGIRAVDFTHGFSRLRVGRSGDGAGVQHDDVGGIPVGGEPQAAGEQIAAKRGGIGFRGATTEIFDRERGHRRCSGRWQSQVKL